MVKIKRIYEPEAQSDGYRVLVDRVWPRGVSKQQASVDEWAKDLAPSTELRRWFGHRSDRFDEFRRRYRDELATQAARIEELSQRASQGELTLVYSARDSRLNNARVLCELIEEGL